MGLPKIDQPLFEVTVPSTDKKAKFRPFTVKEEKILLIAQESEDQNQIFLAVKQIINNCTTGVDVDKLATFDLEYLILMIRGKSVDNMMKFGFVDEETEENVNVEIDINDISVKTPEGHNKKIVLNDQYHIMMKYPTLSEVKMLQEVDDNLSQTDQMFSTMTGCIDILVDNNTDEIFKLEDFSKVEISDFVDGFNGAVIGDIKTFFDTMPKLTHTIQYKDKNDKDKEFVVEGMDSFFT